MLEKEHYKNHLPQELYQKLEEICNGFKEIHKETDGMLKESKPDSSAQLADVLKSTEEATNTILDSATAIQTLLEGVPADVKTKAGEHITRIFEASTFQDITGQRIKKVLKTLDQIEQKLYKLIEIAQPYSGDGAAAAQPGANQKVNLLQGPALTGSAPTQAEVDRLLAGKS